MDSGGDQHVPGEGVPARGFRRTPGRERARGADGLRVSGPPFAGLRGERDLKRSPGSGGRYRSPSFREHAGHCSHEVARSHRCATRTWTIGGASYAKRYLREPFR